MHEPSRELLEASGLRPKKSFGQNFLTDSHHLEAIARAVASLVETKDTDIVEFGPGAGALTAHLVDVGVVHGVERDRDLVPILRERFGRQANIIEDNAATVALDGYQDFVLAGNLPYHMTSTLLFRALHHADRLRGAVFLVQREVAERVASPEGSKRYGILSVLVQHRFVTELTHVVPRGAFWPVPDVDGGVLRLRTRAERAPVPRLEEVVKAAFAARRKTLRNTIGKRFPGALARAGIDEKRRPETLNVDEFVALAEAAFA